MSWFNSRGATWTLALAALASSAMIGPGCEDKSPGVDDDTEMLETYERAQALLVEECPELDGSSLAFDRDSPPLSFGDDVQVTLLVETTPPRGVRHFDLWRAHVSRGDVTVRRLHLEAKRWSMERGTMSRDALESFWRTAEAVSSARYADRVAVPDGEREFSLPPEEPLFTLWTRPGLAGREVTWRSVRPGVTFRVTVRPGHAGRAQPRPRG